jgi:SSS family solute:Na+ symporter
MLAETQTFSIIDTTLNHWDWIVIGFYFAFITGIGFLFKHVNKDSSDYFRGGGNMLWWMAGM